MRIPCRPSPHPARLHVIDTLRGVQVGGDPSRAETRRGRWSHGSPSAPTSAGRAGKSFLRKPREMSTWTARLGFLDGWAAGGRGRAGGAPPASARAVGTVVGDDQKRPRTVASATIPPPPSSPLRQSNTSRARNRVPRAKRLLQVAVAVLSVSVMSGPRSRSTLMRQPAPSSAWKSWLRRSIARPTCQTPLHNSRPFRALPALHEQLCTQCPPCLAYRYRRFRRRKVWRPQRSTWAAR